MTARGFWFLAGAGAGAYAVLRGRRVAEVFTLDGMGDRLGALAVGARLFRDELAQGMADAEPAIRERIEQRTTGPAELSPAAEDPAVREGKGTA